MVWSDGWWVGVVTGLDDTGDGTMQIYFPGMIINLHVHFLFASFSSLLPSVI